MIRPRVSSLCKKQKSESTQTHKYTLSHIYVDMSDYFQTDTYNKWVNGNICIVLYEEMSWTISRSNFTLSLLHAKTHGTWYQDEYISDKSKINMSEVFLSHSPLPSLPLLIVSDSLNSLCKCFGSWAFFLGSFLQVLAEFMRCEIFPLFPEQAAAGTIRAHTARPSSLACLRSLSLGLSDHSSPLPPFSTLIRSTVTAHEILMKSIK